MKYSISYELEGNVFGTNFHVIPLLGFNNGETLSSSLPLLSCANIQLYEYAKDSLWQKLTAY